jgi:aspartate kinase
MAKDMLPCVIKIGGSLLKNGKSYLEAAREVKKLFVERGMLPIIVVSAAKGVTDALLEVSKGHIEAISEVYEKYGNVAEELKSSKVCERMLREIKVLEDIVKVASKNCDTKLQDLILSYGERISKMLMVEALEIVGVKAIELDAREFIVTNDVHGDASIDYTATRSRLEKIMHLLKATSIIPVIEGFVGATEHGEVTTLGRGGSDYTATAIAALLGIDKVYLVTEVDGIMTADPTIIPTARIVDVMSYREAVEAAMHGAKRINPKSFEPLNDVYHCVVYVGSWNSFGTKISHTIPDERKGPKIVLHRHHGEKPYIAIIGEGVNYLDFIKKVVDILYENNVDIKGVQTYFRKPSLIIHVEGGCEMNVLKLLHQKLFEEEVD